MERAEALEAAARLLERRDIALDEVDDVDPVPDIGDGVRAMRWSLTYGARNCGTKSRSYNSTAYRSVMDAT